MKNKKKLLIVLGKGGHTQQMINLTMLLGNRYEYEYIIGKNDVTSKNKIVYPGKIWYTTTPRTYQTNLLKTIINTILSFLESFIVTIKSNAVAVIGCGPGINLPIAIWFKIFRRKVIFIESWSRVRVPSKTGKIVYKFADLFFIQWKQLKKYYPKAIYAGRLG